MFSRLGIQKRIIGYVVVGLVLMLGAFSYLGIRAVQQGTELVLSPNTVRTHRDRIMAKLDLHNKAALIRYAVAHGLIEATE